MFTKDLNEDAEKLLKRSLGRPAAANVIVIASEHSSPAQLFSQLQSYIYALVEHLPTPGDGGGRSVIRLLDGLRDSLTVHQLPDNLNRVAGLMSVQLVLLCVANRSATVDECLLHSGVQLWRSNRLRQFAVPPAPLVEDLDEAAAITGGAGEVRPARASQPSPYMFANVVSVETMRNIYAASWRHGGHQPDRQQQQCGLEALERLLRALLAADLLTVHELNEQSVRLLRWSWPDEPYLAAMAAMLRRLGEDDVTRRAPAEVRMFLGMMADLAQDLECL